MESEEGHQLRSSAVEVVYLFTTFPKRSETFVQREVKGLLAAGLRLELRTIWGGKRDFEGHSVLRFSLWELIGIPLWLLYWAGKKPRVIGEFWAALFQKPTSRLNALEMWLGTAYGLLKAKKIGESPATKIHTAWATMPTTAALLIYRLTGKPFSMGAHAYDIFLGTGDGLLSHKVAAALFVQSSNETARLELERRFPEHVEKLHCVRRCLDRFPKFEPREILHAQNVDFIAVGRLVAKKGYLRMLSLIKAANENSFAWRLKIIGEGPLEASIKAEIERLGLSQSVKLLGGLPYESVKMHYAAANAFIFAGIVSDDGDRDGLPNVIPEAMAYGLPVFAAPAPGVQEAVQDNETGWLVDFDDAARGVSQIVKAIDGGALSRGVQNARDWVETHFDSEKTTETLMRLHRVS